MAEAWPAFGLTLAALAIESVVGYPVWLHRRLPHPVVWVGWAIGRLERRLNRPNYAEITRRVWGIVTIVLIAGAAGGVGFGLDRLLDGNVAGFAILILLATTGLAQKSLYRHVARVAAALRNADLPAARTAVGMIVGRDVGRLTESEIAAAGLESLGESFNDGVVAPAFWLVVAGLPGIFAYKAINTADSMIGHMEERWRAFGWAAARLDDLLNLIPARIAGGLIALAGWGGFRTMLRDAPKHASPNAGWPEAAMAGALSVRLGGPTSYDGVLTQRPTFGDGQAPAAADLARGLKIYVGACLLLWLAVAIGALTWRR